MTGKRKRGDNFSAHEKLVHKSCSLLQREAKKVRTFLVRKVVQQLKQLHQQQEESVQDAVKQQKLRHSVDKVEREHSALKALDMSKLITRAKLKTGLDKPQADAEIQIESEEWDEEGSDSEVADNDEVQDPEQNEAMDESEREEQKENVEGESAGAEQQAIGEKAQVEQDKELEEKLIDRMLAHKKLIPVLNAIKTLVEKEEKEIEKKRRVQEKRALKRGRHESLVGNTGRSGVIPTSLFLGSLSGRNGADNDLGMGIDEYGTMAGADDDIAEFLGEKKKRKNRPGQIARRMKAMRKEEAFKRKEDRERGMFVPYKSNSDSTSRYGPSERPKKVKPKAKASKGDKEQLRGRSSRVGSKETTSSIQEQHVTRAPAASMVAAHPSWLAKQKQKEKENASLTAYSGKKITFD